MGRTFFLGGLGFGPPKWNGTERDGMGFKPNGTVVGTEKQAGVSVLEGARVELPSRSFLLFFTIPPPSSPLLRSILGRRRSRNPSRPHRRGEERSVKHAAPGGVAARHLQARPRQRLVSFVWFGLVGSSDFACFPIVAAPHTNPPCHCCCCICDSVREQTRTSGRRRPTSSSPPTTVTSAASRVRTCGAETP
jgi:hypothetical protein